MNAWLARARDAIDTMNSELSPGTVRQMFAVAQSRLAEEMSEVLEAMTTRGMTEADFVRVANLIDQGVQIAIDIKKKTEGGKLKDFKAYLDENDVPAIAALRAEVEAFADEFHMPGGPVI